MTREELDQMWSKATEEAIAAGEQFTRYRFAALVAEAERMACAFELWEMGKNERREWRERMTLFAAATAIRAGGNT